MDDELSPPDEEAAATFLPNIERARGEGVVAQRKVFGLPWWSLDLLGATPDEIEPLAVVIVEARVQRRISELKDVQVAARLLDQLATAAPPEPTDFTDARTAYLVERSDISDCQGCEGRPGEIACTACAGTGRVDVTDSEGNAVLVACYLCKGHRYITCPTCEGAGHAHWARLVQVEDSAPSLRYAYVPSMVDALDLAVGELFDELPAELPACLRFDPTPRKHESAYRGEVRQMDRGFFGHGFGDALDRAMRGVAALGAAGEVIRRDLAAYAWPMLWLRYASIARRAEVGLVISPLDRRHRALVVAGG